MHILKRVKGKYSGVNDSLYLLAELYSTLCWNAT